MTPHIYVTGNVFFFFFFRLSPKSSSSSYKHRVTKTLRKVLIMVIHTRSCYELITKIRNPCTYSSCIRDTSFADYIVSVDQRLVGIVMSRSKTKKKKFIFETVTWIFLWDAPFTARRPYFFDFFPGLNYSPVSYAKYNLYSFIFIWFKWQQLTDNLQSIKKD